MDNLYEVLDIKENASTYEIKASFYNLTKATHPYYNGGNQLMTTKFREIAKAYAILSDPEQRKYWDEFYQKDTGLPQSDARGNLYDSKAIDMRVANIERTISSFYKEADMYKKDAGKTALIGVAWCVGGLAITLATYLMAVYSGGGSYIVAYGAVMFGGVQAFRNIRRYIKINEAVTVAEKKMWNNF